MVAPMGWLRRQGRAFFAVGAIAFAVQMLAAVTCCLPYGQQGAEARFAGGAFPFVICTSSGLMNYDPVTGEQTPVNEDGPATRHAALCAGVCAMGVALPVLFFLLLGVFAARGRIRPPLDARGILVSFAPAFFGRAPPLPVPF